MDAAGGAEAPLLDTDVPATHGSVAKISHDRSLSLNRGADRICAAACFGNVAWIAFFASGAPGLGTGSVPNQVLDGPVQSFVNMDTLCVTPYLVRPNPGHGLGPAHS